MIQKEKKNAALMSETVRNVLTDEKLMNSLMDSLVASGKQVPVYWNSLSTKDGVTAMVVAQMLKAMAGDTNAFSALSKYGFGEKVQMEVSDYYRDTKLEIEVVNPDPIIIGDEEREAIESEATESVKTLLGGGDESEASSLGDE